MPALSINERGELKMIRYAWLTMLALLNATAALTTYAADVTSEDAEAIAKIERGWGEALKTKNKAFLEKNLSDNFQFTRQNGDFYSGRSAYIDAAMKMPAWVEVTVSDDVIRVYQTTAVATGRMSYKDSSGASGAIRYTDTLAKGPDGWTAVASQETKAP